MTNLLTTRKFFHNLSVSMIFKTVLIGLQSGTIHAHVRSLKVKIRSILKIVWGPSLKLKIQTGDL